MPEINITKGGCCFRPFIFLLLKETNVQLVWGHTNASTFNRAPLSKSSSQSGTASDYIAIKLRRTLSTVAAAGTLHGIM